MMACAGLAGKNVSAQMSEPISSSDKLKRLRFGVFVAPTISWMKPTAEKDGSQIQNNGGSKPGLIYGLMGDYYFTDNYAIASGLYINSGGGKIHTSNDVISTVNPWAITRADINYTLQYLEIPVALKLRTDEINKMRFFGQVGLTVAFNISKKFSYDITATNSNSGADSLFVSEEKAKITGGVGNIIPVLFQMNIGAGMQYAIGPKLDAYVGFFFNNGFTPDVTSPEKYANLPVLKDAAYKDGTTRLNNFALRLGFYF